MRDFISVQQIPAGGALLRAPTKDDHLDPDWVLVEKQVHVAGTAGGAIVMVTAHWHQPDRLPTCAPGAERTTSHE